MTAIDRLIDLSQGPLVDEEPDLDHLPSGCNSFGALLLKVNGFYAFDRALHVFHLSGAGKELECIEWNAPSLWAGCYGSAVDGTFFFAEDAFGTQFGFVDGVVVRFDPETATSEPIALDVEGWAAAVLEDDRWLTGWPLLREWQQENGPIPPRKRLLPVIPFIAGGEYRLANLRAVDSVESMLFRCDFWRQTGHLPPGSRVRVVDKDEST
jgi:hypothetical protein